MYIWPLRKNDLDSNQGLYCRFILMLSRDCSFMLLAGNATHKRCLVARTPIVLPVAYMSYDSGRALTLGLDSAKLMEHQPRL